MTSKGACVFSILTQDASEAVNLSIKHSNYLFLYYLLLYWSMVHWRICLSWEKNQDGNTCWGAFIWSCYLSMLDHTTAICFFGVIKAFSLTWCNFGASFLPKALSLKKNSKWGHLLRSIHLISQSFNIDHTTIISFFVGIKTFSLTSCNFGARLFPKAFSLKKNSKLGC